MTASPHCESQGIARHQDWRERGGSRPQLDSVIPTIVMAEASRYTLSCWVNWIRDTSTVRSPCHQRIHKSSSEGGGALFLHCREALFANRPLQPAQRTAIQSRFFLHFTALSSRSMRFQTDTRLNYTRYFMTNANAPNALSVRIRCKCSRTSHL